MNRPAVVSRSDWLEARTRLLAKEKHLTRLRDELLAERRQHPWVKIDKCYVFQSASGPKTLADLFADRSQLLIKHFMFGPGWQEGCVGCSFECDHIQGALVHLRQRDVSFVSVARAPIEQIEPFRRRMGWTFPWVSSFGSDFNYDFHVSFTPEEMAAEAYYNYRNEKVPCEELSGLSAFYRDSNGDIFHTYSCFGRGGEEVLGTYMLLDLLPKGRDEHGPNYNLTDWVRHHDKYGSSGYVDSSGRHRESAPCCSAQQGI